MITKISKFIIIIIIIRFVKRQNVKRLPWFFYLVEQLFLSTVYDKPKYLVKGRPTRIKWVRLCLLSKLVSC